MEVQSGAGSQAEPGSKAENTASACTGKHSCEITLSQHAGLRADEGEDQRL